MKNKHVSKLKTSGNDQGHQLLASEGNYRALFEHMPDGILIADSHCYYLDANPSMCKLLGYRLDELVGMHASQIVSEPELEHIEPILNSINAGDECIREWRFRRKDGSFFEAEVYISHMPDGNLLSIVHDITLIKSREREISRLSLLYEALSQVNQAIVLMATREELFQNICRILVEFGGFSMAWVGWHNPVLQKIVPIATCGDHNDYIKSINIFTDDRPEGLGPTSVAFSTRRPYICNNMQSDPITLPWRAEITHRNFRASAAFLIRERGEVSGTLTVYADTDYFFQNKEIALLDEAALNISFALDNLLREQESIQANLIASSERQFSNTMIDSMPGIMYFYDIQGKFLRWNKNFEVVSGFSSDEIANMHPLDFFEDRYKPLLEEKIKEVFELGESSIEAPFLSKAGKTTQYFFTGRKVVFNDVDCLVGVGIDITELKQTELLLAENELKYRELVENANSIILRWNSEGKITFLNEYGQHYFGYNLEEIMGQHVVGSIVPPMDTDGNDMHPLMQQIRSNPAAFEQNINQNIRRNGELVWIAWTNKCVFDTEGNIIEVLSIGSDITRERHADETIRELNANLEQANKELELDLARRKEAEDKIEQLAFYDPLTNLPNRRLLHDRLKHSFAANARHQNYGALLFIDLDNFKALNDRKGHNVGDQLLVMVARRLQATAREGDTIARIGGDEFIVILDNLSANSEQAASMAEVVGDKFLDALSKPYLLIDYEYRGTASIGVSLFHNQQFSVEELLRRSDTAMYQAKSNGRNTLRFYDPAMQAAVEARVELESDLRMGLSGNQFVLFYQPQVNQSGQIFGAESLIRWQSPQKGLVPPIQFIPLAEETGLILPIGKWVLETACDQLKAWESDPVKAELKLAINVSARQFYQPNFVEHVLETFINKNINPNKLKLELTESIVVEDINTVITKMHALRDAGVQFSLDDFGTGYSSLSYLTQLPISQLKIDQTFVRNIGVKHGDSVIVQTIIGMAENLGMNVIAEGVETQEQYDFLRENGCTLFQGYLFGKPLPIEKFDSLISEKTII